MAIELSQIAILRRVLESFCSQHHLALADRAAVIAASELMRFATEGETDPVKLAARLEETMGDHLSRERSINRPSAVRLLHMDGPGPSP